MQSGIVIGENEISGALEHITGYEGFSDDPEEQEGFYLALSLSAVEGARIFTELVGGTKGETEVTDGFCVYRITDRNAQQIKITARKGSYAIEKEYALTELTEIDHVRDSENSKVKDSSDGDIESTAEGS